MNKAYRLIKNRHSGLVQVAPETAKAHGKSTTLKIGAGATALRGVTCTVAMLALLVALPATAEEITWVGGFGGNWSGPSNWNLARLPTGADNAIVDGPLIYGTSGAEANTLYLGNLANSQLIIQGSSTMSTTNAYLGYNTGIEGVAAVFGASASWTNSGSFTIGHNGTGTLLVQEGGALNVAAGTGTVVLASGSGSGTLNIGNNDTAGILNAATVTGGIGTATLNFNHTDGDYYFTKDGTSGGASIVITGSTAVNHIGSGKTTLTGNNTYTGGTTVSAGTLALDGGTALADTGAVTVNGGTLEVLAAETIGSLAGTGGIVDLLAGLTVGDANSTAYSGVIQGAGTLTKQGAGTLTLSGASTYTGVTTISAGTLALSGSGTLGATANGNLTVDGGTLDLGGTSQTKNTTITLTDGAINNGTLTSSGGFAVQKGSIGAILAGTAGLTKTGTDTVTFTGVNTYTGGTTVKAGALAVSGTGRINSGAMSVGEASGDDGTLIIEAGGQVGSSLSFIGKDSGSTGAVTITGAGSTWNVSGTLYAGSGTGTLTIEDGGALNSFDFAVIGYNGGGGTATVTGAGSTWTANRIYVGQNGTGTLDIADEGEVSSNDRAYIGSGATGTGTVTVAGAGTTWTITNELFVGIGSGGTGTLTINNGGAVSSGTGYIGESLGSLGTVTVTGAGSTLTTPFDLHVGYFGTGTLNIGNYDLSAPDTAGTVTANRLTTNASGSGTVNFNQTDAIAFATPIQGNIAVNQRGTGTTTLSGTHTYTGATTISGGTLAVNGSLTNSAVTVNSGGTLGGSGSIAGAVAVNSGGTLAPGNSPGLLTVGSLTLDAGSTTVMEIDGTTRGTQYDAIDVTGTATLGGTLNLIFGYTPSVGDSYTLIDAAAINGDFSTIATTGLGDALKVVPTITDDYVMTVNFSQESFVTTAGGMRALTGNQSGVAANLDTFSTSGQAADLIAALNTLPAGALPSAFDQLSGASHAFAPILALNAVRQFHHVLGQRGSVTNRGGASTAFNGLMGAKLAYAGDNLASLMADEELAQDGFWVRTLAADGRIDGDRNVAGADTSGAGLALGADRWIDANRLAGVALAYGTSQADSDGSKLDVTSFQLAAYGRWQGEAYYLDGSLGYGRHRTESRRDIAFMNQRARADYDTDSLSLNIEAGRPIVRGPATLTPYMGIEGTRLRREGFTETGSAANLSVQGRTETRWRARLGARYQWSGARYQPTLDLAWVHAFGDAATRVDARFAAVPAAPTFRVAGPKLDRDRLALGLGLTAWTGKNARLDLAYNGEFAGSDREQHVAATFRWAW